MSPLTILPILWFLRVFAMETIDNTGDQWEAAVGYLVEHVRNFVKEDSEADAGFVEAVEAVLDGEGDDWAENVLDEAACDIINVVYDRARETIAEKEAA